MKYASAPFDNGVKVKVKFALRPLSRSLAVGRNTTEPGGDCSSILAVYCDWLNTGALSLMSWMMTLRLTSELKVGKPMSLALTLKVYSGICSLFRVAVVLISPDVQLTLKGTGKW